MQFTGTPSGGTVTTCGVVLAVGVAGIASKYFSRNNAVNDLTKKINVVGSKVDALDNSLTAKVSALDSRLTAQVSVLDSRLTAKVDALDSKLTAVDNKIITKS